LGIKGYCTAEFLAAGIRNEPFDLNLSRKFKDVLNYFMASPVRQAFMFEVAGNQL